MSKLKINEPTIHFVEKIISFQYRFVVFVMIDVLFVNNELLY